MKYILIVCLLLLLTSPAVLAHGGEDHGEQKPAGALPVGARKAERTISTASGQFQFVLTQVPADPRTGEEVQFEVRIAEVVEGGFAGGQLPVEGAQVSGQLKTANGSLVAKNLPAHSEGQAGVYGIHYTFTDDGDYKLVFDITTKDGKPIAVDFPIAVASAPVRYTPYALDLILLAATLVITGVRYRSVAGKAGYKAALWRTLPYAAIAFSVFAFSVILIHATIPATEPRAVAATPTMATDSNPNTVTVPKESQLLFGIRTEQVQKQKIVSGITVTGVVKVQSQLKAEVVPPVSGRTRASGNFTVGSYVRQGQTLAVVEQVLSAPEAAGLEATRVDLRAKTAELQAQATQALTRRNAAQIEYNRAKKLYDADAIPLKRVQEAELQLKLAEQELKAAGLQAEITQVGEKRVEPIKTFSLQAPISGVIAASSFTPGEQVEAGTPLFTIMNLDRVWIEAQVFEKDLAAITTAKRASFRAAAFPNDVFQIGENTPNRLLTVGASLDPDKRTVPVVYEVTNPNGRLRDGMSAEITIDTTGDHEVISVPKAAVLDEQGQKLVYVYNGAEQFIKRKVTVGSEGQTGIEILSGLEPGERVVVEGVYQLRSIAPSGK